MSKILPMLRLLDAPQTDADRLAFAAAKRICQRHARSFYFASFFLPKHKRDAAYAVYAFCRMIDDAIDVTDGESGQWAVGSRQSCGSVSELDQRLAMFRKRLDSIYEGQLCPPESAARYR